MAMLTQVIASSCLENLDSLLPQVVKAMLFGISHYLSINCIIDQAIAIYILNSIGTGQGHRYLHFLIN